nr:MAG TPA: hypothetical protein [Caudoviricetes sp.]
MMKKIYKGVCSHALIYKGVATRRHPPSGKE